MDLEEFFLKLLTYYFNPFDVIGVDFEGRRSNALKSF